MLQTFCFQTMFRDIRQADVKKMASQVVCCATGQRVSHEEWLAIVKDGGQMKFCLPDHVNGRPACIPTRELVEKITPGFRDLKLTLIDRYAVPTTTRKRRSAKKVSGFSGGSRLAV